MDVVLIISQKSHHLKDANILIDRAVSVISTHMDFELPELTKRYYSIGEVAEIFDVNTSLLRYWEKEFPRLHPKKSSKGNRMYTPKDIEQIRLVYHLVKERGFTIDGARKKLRDNADDVAQEAEVIQRLRSVKEKLISIKKQL